MQLTPTLNAGFQNFVLVDKIIGIANSKCASSRRIMKETKYPVIDYTMNRACLSIIILTNGMVVKSAIPRIQLLKRLLDADKEPDVVKKTTKKVANAKTSGDE